MYNDNRNLVLLRGGGDLASGVALRLHRAGIKVVITELAQPLAVRRTVSFAETVYQGVHTVEEVTARCVTSDQVSATLAANEIPVLIDPNADILTFDLRPWTILTVIDGRLLKTPPHPLPIDVPLHIGLGPGFDAGVNCHAVIETRRSHTLGRVYWSGTTQPDSGQPEGDRRRVLRAPIDGILLGDKKIGEYCESGERIAVIQSSTLAPDSHLSGRTVPGSASVENRQHLHRTQVQVSEIVSPFQGILRGLIHDGVHVTQGLKIGDVDPRNDASACFLVSDKALSIGGGVLEAILTREEIRQKLWKGS